MRTNKGKNFFNSVVNMRIILITICLTLSLIFAVIPANAKRTWHHNLAPIANAGSNQTVNVGALVTLNGSGSYDPNGEAITYQWSLTSRPSGSSASLANSTTATPKFSPDVAGNYVASLVVTDSTNLKSNASTATVTANSIISPPPAPVASFKANPTSGAAPLAVQFTDSSTGSPTSWSWAFGDGATSTSQNPSHTYNGGGTFTVTLTASNTAGSSSANATITVSSTSKPVANFTANPTSGNAPLAVQFTDTSTGSPTSWSWTFGDGAASTVENPSHTYSSAGTFTITLTASNASGSSSKSLSISVTDPPPPSGVSYYIDSVGGNDSWPGSQAQPWKTIAKVNSFNIPAGANILFKCGDTWTETLHPSVSGTSGSPIVFGSYGTGALPVIDGQNARGPVVSISTSYVTLQDIEVKNSTANGVEVQPANQGVTNVLVQRVTLHDNQGSGINPENPSKVYPLNNITVTKCTCYNNGMFGITLAYAIDHCTVSHNVCYNNGLIPNSQWGWHGISFYGPDTTNRPSYITVEYNEVYNQQQAWNGAGAEGAGIQGDDNCDHMTFRYNYVHDNQGPGLVCNKNTNNDLYYNVCVNNNTGTGYGGEVVLENCSNIHIYNNVLYGNKNGDGIFLYSDPSVATCANITIENNNIGSNSDADILLLVSTNAHIANLVCNNNCIYSPNNSNNFAYLGQSGGFSWWQSQGLDLAGMNKNPMFVSTNSTSRNFSLQSSSPCIKTGANVGLTQDYTGYTVPSTPDIGAYEYH
jgi:parallel beta-helix repeat protein